MASLYKKVIGGRPYWYLREMGWVDGKPKMVCERYLGTAAEVEALLEAREQAMLPERTRHLEFGAVAAVWGLLSDLGVAALIDEAVGAPPGLPLSPGTYLMLAACNRVVDPCSKRGFAHWWRTTAADRFTKISASALDHRRFWDAMHAVPLQALARIEEQLALAICARFGLDTASVALDMTNFATFIDTGNDKAPIAQRGKAKQKRADLRLVGLGLVVTRDGGIPLLSHAYPANIALQLPDLVRTAGYPGTRVVPATSWLLSLLALKLTRTRRVSHVDDLLLSDPAAALSAGLATLPKKSALTDYSYRTCHDHQRRFLAALDTTMIDTGLATADNAIFDLDFHAVMHWGQDPALEKHYVPTRSQRARSVLTFFAQDTGTHNLVYANADISKSGQNREVIAFCDHWKAASGNDPAMLIMDQKVTTHAVLGELDARGVTFLTLRMRSPALVRQIDALTNKDFRTVTLDRPGRFNRPKVHEATGIRLTGYPGTVRQLVVTGLGRDTPTVIITNDHDLTAKTLIAHYARRMTIEQRLAEIIGAFHADALSSAVNLNVDLDIMLCVLAQALTAALRTRLPGYNSVTPDVLQRRFLETPGTITTNDNTITVRLDRRAYSPVLRQADLPQDTPVPWWGNRTLRYEFS